MAASPSRVTPPARLREVPAQRDASAPRPLDCADAVLAIMPAVMDAMRSAMRVHVGEQLSVPQFRCLNFIAKQPGCSVTAVATFLGVTLPTASAMVDRLVKSGAVAPTTAATDRRRSELQLTDSGQALLLQIRGDARGEFARALGRCSSDELRQLLAGMAVLETAFASAGPT